MKSEIKLMAGESATNQHRQTKLSESDKRKRKALLVLPLLCLPFIALAFWALGGGRPKQGIHTEDPRSRGLNTQLPGPNLKGDQWLDKLAYYEKAEADSVKQRERNGYDHYYTFPPLDGHGSGSRGNGISTGSSESLATGSLPGTAAGQVHFRKGSFEEREATVNARIKALDQLLEQGAESRMPKKELATARSKSLESPTDEPNVEEIHTGNMESPLNELGQEPASKDPEIEQLNNLLEKILSIQQGGNAKEVAMPGALTAKSPAQRLEVSAAGNSVTILGADAQGMVGPDATAYGDPSATGFFSLDAPRDKALPASNAIPAVVDETRTITDGATVAIRLTAETNINGQPIPVNTLVYGLASLNGERLQIKISHIRYGNALIPVSLSVFDMDGVEGIYIPGAMGREVSKSGLDRAAQGTGINTLDAGIGAQAASAGIEAAKSLISKKAKQQRVTVKAGYRILLYNSQQ